MTIDATAQNYQCAIVLSHLEIQNANAVSGPMSWGFPAMHAFAGFAHALQRQLQSEGRNISFNACGVVCHSAQPMIASGPSYKPRSFRLTRNPLDQTGGTSAIVEEARMHMTVSLVLATSGGHAPRQSGAEADALADEIFEKAMSMRIAGGSLMNKHKTKKTRAFVWNNDSKQEVQRKLLRTLLPGFALIGRSDLLASHKASMQTQDSDATTMDALLDLCALHSKPKETANEGGKHQWTATRREKGFLVPIPMGFIAISETYPAGQVKNARDNTAPFRFVESALGLGEWKSPHRFNDIEDLLWRYQAQPEQGTYLITNTQAQ